MSSMLRKHRRNPGHAMGRSTYGNVGHGAVPSNYLQPHRNPGYAYGAEAMQVNAASAGRQTCPTNAMGAGGHTTFYNLPGKAGIPGCGTGTVAGSECGLQILPYRSETVAPGALATLRIAALRAGALSRPPPMCRLPALRATSVSRTRLSRPTSQCRCHSWSLEPIRVRHLI